MTPRELFDKLGPLVAPAVAWAFDRQDCCILATRVAIEVARHFGIEAEAVPVKVIVYNRAFARHVACRFTDVADPENPASWGDDSWSVGIGCGKPSTRDRWDGHLIAVAGDAFGDFSIIQAERPQHDIRTGPAIVGPYSPSRIMWQAVEETTGTTVEYTRIADETWRKAPDWKDAARRRPIVGRLVRQVRRTIVPCVAQ